MNLYQFVSGHQPHYVVALNFADAETTILERYSSPEKIEDLGPYVQISADVETILVIHDDT